jgi:hypothetical protein
MDCASGKETDEDTMEARAEMDAEVYGFKTVAVATCEDEQHMEFGVHSGCDGALAIAAALTDKEVIDAY